jgi:hypothetical protein
LKEILIMENSCEDCRFQNNKIFLSKWILTDCSVKIEMEQDRYPVKAKERNMHMYTYTDAHKMG